MSFQIHGALSKNTTFKSLRSTTHLEPLIFSKFVLYDKIDVKLYYLVKKKPTT